MFKCHFDAGFIDTQYNVVHKGTSRSSFRRRSRLRARRTPAASGAMCGPRARGCCSSTWNRLGRRTERRWKRRLGAATLRGTRCRLRGRRRCFRPSMIEGSLALARSLDQRFGTVTTGAKMTDVPGHTRGIIAPLARHGVTFLEIGVNGGSTPAELPPIFLWKDPSRREPGDDVSPRIRRRGRGSGIGPGAGDRGARRQQRAAHGGGDCADSCGIWRRGSRMRRFGRRT